MRFQGKSVVVTGASAGIGLAIARAFGARGAKLTISGRNAENLNAAAAELRAAGADVLAIPGDVSRWGDCEELIGGAIARSGGVDILINNAGISMRSLFADTDIAVLRQLMEVNFWGAVNCTKLAYASIQARRGSIVASAASQAIRGCRHAPDTVPANSPSMAFSKHCGLRIERQVCMCSPAPLVSRPATFAIQHSGAMAPHNPKLRLMKPA